MVHFTGTLKIALNNSQFYECYKTHQQNMPDYPYFMGECVPMMYIQFLHLCRSGLSPGAWGSMLLCCLNHLCRFWARPPSLWRECAHAPPSLHLLGAWSAACLIHENECMSGFPVCTFSAHTQQECTTQAAACFPGKFIIKVWVGSRLPVLPLWCLMSTKQAGWGDLEFCSLCFPSPPQFF